jgi:hypothetical protein
MPLLCLDLLTALAASTSSQVADRVRRARLFTVSVEGDVEADAAMGLRYDKRIFKVPGDKGAPEYSRDVGRFRRRCRRR